VVVALYGVEVAMNKRPFAVIPAMPTLDDE
jgi:hypothetical protein